MSATAVEWREIDGALTPTVRGQAMTWAPLPGSQQAFLTCPVYECLYEGTRGGGKTDCLVMDFAQHIGRGFGADWRGILFRQTFPQLQDVIAKSKKWFSQIWPRARYNEARATWTWPTGEMLMFRQMQRSDDYWNYHGHSYPWIAWEELTTWANDGCYKAMMACSRSTRKDMPRKVRSTTNPYGVGHNWVKQRWRLPIAPGEMIGPVIQDGTAPPRVAIRSKLSENQVLLTADPGYIERIREAARNPSERAAWLEGDWNIVAGGMFDDLWIPELHVLPNLTPDMIPRGWKINRSYDHGQSKPFSVGWWAQSNGEPIEVDGRILGQVGGDLFRVYEWYGWNGSANEGLRMSAGDIAKGILEREEEWGLRGRVGRGIADGSIFDAYEENKSVAGDMRKAGVHWDAADKGPGSRRQGWEQIRARLRGAFPGEDGTREEKGLFVCQRCEQFLRTIPVLPRDDKDLDDIDDESEDHVADEVRYRVRAKLRGARSGRWK